MLQKQNNQATNERKISREYFYYGIFVLILLYQAIHASWLSQGPLFIGTFIEPFFGSMSYTAFVGPGGLILAVPIFAVYYFLLVHTFLLIIHSRKWLSVILVFPIIALVCLREWNIEYSFAYYRTYRDMTSNEACKNTDALHAHICKLVVKRNVYQKTHVEYCRTLRQDYSSCIQDIVFFTKDISTCSFLNQDIALKYTGSSTAPYLRDCVMKFVNQEHLTLEQACSVFTVATDYDDCIDVFIEQTKDWSLCDTMKDQPNIDGCKHRNEYIEYIKSQKR